MSNTRTSIWRVDVSTTHGQQNYLIHDNTIGKPIAQMLKFNPYPIDPKEISNKANLIALSPEILRSLKAVTKALECFGTDLQRINALREAKETIAICELYMSNNEKV